MLRRSPLLPFALGLAVLYVAERTLAGTARLAFDAAAGLLLATGLALALWRWSRVWGAAANESRKAAGTAAALYLLGLAAVGLYVVGERFFAGAEQTAARTLITVAWPFLLLLAVAPALAVELALAGMAQAPTLELWRVRLASRAALVVVLAMVAFAGANYAASRWNRKIDLSYFRVTRPSEPTLTLVRELSEPVRVVVFAPPGNDVMDQARAYLEELGRASSQVRLEVVDQALAPELARELKVRQNGAVAFTRGGRAETLTIGLEMEAARGVLKKLDAEVQERLLRVARPPRTIYFTTGHMERDYQQGAADKRLGLADFRTIADSLGFTIKRLGLAEGLGSAVPSDAGIVVIAGPTEPFLPAERQALRAFLDRGGRLFALVDPDTGVTEDELLAPLGVRVSKALVAGDRATVRVEGKGESPYYFATARASSHPSTATLSENAGRMAVVFLGAGAIERLDDAPGDLRLTYVVHTLAEAWVDKNNNGKLDEASEKRGPRELAVAVERQPQPAAGDAGAKPDAGPAMRAIVVGDADVVGSGIVRNPGNAYLLLDSLKWLAGDDTLTGPTTSEEDVPLVHQRDDDAVWFYGVSFAVPATVLALGLAAGRRSKKRRAA